MNVADSLLHLNSSQRQAVEHINGPLLVLAGAGTGKTRVLTTRIAHLIANNYAQPQEILAVTFTNKAAKEMLSRVEQTLGASFSTTQGLWLGTFHSIGARMLRIHHEIFGLSSDFIIIDPQDQLRLIKNIIADNGFDEQRFAIKPILHFINQWKDRSWLPEQVPPHSTLQYYNEARIIYPKYQQSLCKTNCVDFGDLLLLTLKLFEHHPDILARYQQRFKYILVDEYQDTNQTQYLWLKQLSALHQNICCVGDDDQSIYGWRGAEVKNIVDFQNYYPNATIIRLEQNYRSTNHILHAAHSIISHNRQRLGKKLWSEQGLGEKIQIISCDHDWREARTIATEISRLHNYGYYHYGEQAVLVRASFQTRILEEVFLSEQIPYHIVGGLKFYDRQEIKDVIAYLRLVVSLHDDLAFERVVNLPKRGIGKATLQQIRAFAIQSGVSLLKATKLLLDQGYIKGRARASLGNFITQINGWHLNLSTLPHAELVQKIIHDSGYLAMWQADNSTEARNRIENIEEFYRAFQEFASIQEFLQHVSLISDHGEASVQSEQVSVMTLHAAKGLEFPVVYLPGWEEGLFPHQRSINEPGGVEEERRLAYVGITRAKSHLYILHAVGRRMFNQVSQQQPSRFLAELPEECYQYSRIGYSNHYT